MECIVSACLLVFIVSGLQEVSAEFKFGNNHSNLSAVAGRSVVIPCVPPPDLRVVLIAYDPEEEVLKNAVYRENVGFVMENVTKKQNGKLYRCHIGTEQAHGEDFQCWRLKVLDPEPLKKPEITQGTAPYAVWGRDLYLDCRITVPEGEVFSLNWTVPKSVTLFNYSKDLIFVGKESGSQKSWKIELTVKNVNMTDGGEYTCVAKGAVNEAQASAKVQIREPEPLEKPIIKEGPASHAVRGNNLTLECQITVPKGDKFSLVWEVPSTVAEKRIKDNKNPTFVGDESGNRQKWKTELTITGVGRTDRGKYVCVAKGLVNDASSSIKIDIWEPGNITGEVARAKLNESATLSCHLEGYSLSHFMLFVENSNHPGVKSGRNDINSTHTELRLTFPSVARRHNGTYKCMARDYAGIITNQLSLIVVEEPEVTIKYAKAIGHDSIYLEWTVNDRNDPVEAYHIQQKKNDTEKWEDLPKNFSKDTFNHVARPLENRTTYQFRITARNSVGNSLPAISQWVTTPAQDPEFIPEVKVERISNNSIKVKWTSLPEELNDLIHFFNVSATYSNKVIQWVEVPATNTTVVLADLVDGRVYVINVAACSNWSKECGKSASLTDTVSGGNGQIGLWSGISVAVVVFVIMATLMGIFKRRDLASRKRFMDATLVLFKAGAMKSLDPEKDVADQAELLPYDNKWEFPRKQLKLGKVLGSGAFGVVMKGSAYSIRKKHVITVVAVKMVKATFSLEHMTALTRELKILAHLGKHLNIVNLLGACTKKVSYGELFMIMEFCRFGNLHDYMLRCRDNFVDQIDVVTGNIAVYTCKTNYVRTNDSGINTACSEYDSASEDWNSNDAIVTIGDPASDADYIETDQVVLYQGDFNHQDLKPIGSRDLLSWAWQVSRGMNYLSSKKVLHGDLAARNILLTDHNVVKICDFGLAKSLYSDDIYKKEGRGPLPIKWMAIESIRDRVFSVKSDVWSFGVVLWEFFTLAETPYPGIPNENVYQKLVEGFRMEKPKYATKDIYNMMLSCWDAERSKRPSFGELEDSIENLLEEKVKMDYLDLDAPYAELNAKALADGEKDYLTMKPSEYAPNSTEQAVGGV